MGVRHLLTDSPVINFSGWVVLISEQKKSNQQSNLGSSLQPYFSTHSMQVSCSKFFRKVPLFQSSCYSTRQIPLKEKPFPSGLHSLVGQTLPLFWKGFEKGRKSKLGPWASTYLCAPRAILGKQNQTPVIIDMAGHHCLNTPPGCCLEKGQTGLVQDKNFSFLITLRKKKKKKGRIITLQTLHLKQPENYNSCYDRSAHSCKSLWKNPEGLLPWDDHEELYEY